MERIVAFFLIQVVIQAGVLAEFDFGDRVDEIRAAFGACVGFDERGLRRPTQAHDVSRVHGEAVLAVGGHVEKVKRVLEHRAVGETDDRAVVYESRVERREGTVGPVAARKRPANGLVTGGERFGEAQDRDAGRKPLHLRVGGSKSAVHENEADGKRIPKRVAVEFGVGRCARLESGCCREAAREQRFDARVTPGLIASRRRAELFPAFEGAASYRSEPVGTLESTVSGEPLEIRAQSTREA